jgi:hypothetical protein
MKLLGDGGTTDDTASLKHRNRASRGREVRGADQAVVAAADNDDVTLTRSGHLGPLLDID